MGFCLVKISLESNKQLHEITGNERYKMTLRAILFDLDDTIIDRRLSLFKYANCFVEHFSFNLSPIGFDQINSIFEKIDCGGYKKRDDFFNELTEVLPWIRKPQNSAELRNHWFSIFPKCCVVSNGLFETLNKLSS